MVGEHPINRRCALRDRPSVTWSSSLEYERRIAFAPDVDRRIRLRLRDFEQLLEEPDRELLAWVTYEAEVPANFDTALFRRLREFSHDRERTS